MFKNLSISKRLIAAFSLNVVMLLVVAVVAVTRMSTMDANTQLIVSDLNHKILEFHNLKDRAAHVAVILRDIVMSADASQIDARLAKIDELREANNKGIAGMATMFYTEKGKALYRSLTEANVVYSKELDTIRTLVHSGDFAQAKAELMGPMQKAQVAYFSPLDDLMGVGKAVSAKEAADANAAYISARLWLMLTLLASVVLSVIAGLAIVRSVTRPVKAAAELLGLATAEVRLPLVGLTPESRTHVFQTLMACRFTAPRIVFGEESVHMRGQRGETDLMEVAA